MFIDIHIHTNYWDGCPAMHSATPMIHASPEEIIREYDALGIEKGVILPNVNPEGNYEVQSNEEVLAIVEKHPGRFIPFCNIDPRSLSNSQSAPLGKMMEFYKERGCLGIGEVCANMQFLDPKVQNLFRCAENAGLPVTFHMSAFENYRYGLVDNPGMPQLEETLRRFPRLKLFAHSQAFWAEMTPLGSVDDRLGYPKGPVSQEGRVQELMRKYPNLYGDLSAGSGFNALARDPDYAVKFLDEFQDRLLFGTDECNPTMSSMRLLAPFLKKLHDQGGISDAVFHKIARGNAIRILGLKDA